VTFIQRIGGIANLNPHFHSLLQDGLFVLDPDGLLTFHPLPPPTNGDMQTICARLARRL
jgi:hypothetical protein